MNKSVKFNNIELDTENINGNILFTQNMIITKCFNFGKVVGIGRIRMKDGKYYASGTLDPFMKEMMDRGHLKLSYDYSIEDGNYVMSCLSLIDTGK